MQLPKQKYIQMLINIALAKFAGGFLIDTVTFFIYGPSVLIEELNVYEVQDE